MGWERRRERKRREGKKEEGGEGNIFREEEIRHVLNGVLTQTQKTARTDAK